MVSDLGNLLPGVYSRKYDGRRLGFVGIWAVNNKSLVVSLKKQGDEYVMGGEIGYSLERLFLISRPIRELTLCDLKEEGFIFFDEYLVYADEIGKARKALSVVELERHG